MEKEQNKIFEHFGLNRQEGIKKNSLIKKDIDFKLRNSEMSSEMRLFFQVFINRLHKDILEII